MQQTITVNIVEPTVADTPSIDGNLPQTGDAITNRLAEHPLIFVIIGLVIVAGVVALCSRKMLRGGGIPASSAVQALGNKRFFIAPFLLLAPLALFTAQLALTQPSQTAYAETDITTALDFSDNYEVNVPVGQTSFTQEFNFGVRGYSDGYLLLSSINSAASDTMVNDGDISFSFDGTPLLVDNFELSRFHKDSVKPFTQAEFGQNRDFTAQLTVNIPAGAPLGANYAVATFEHFAVDFNYVYTFQDPAVYGDSGELNGRIYFNPDPISGTCATEMKVYGTVGPQPGEVKIWDYRGSGVGQMYRVRKLADDKCWMVDNLKLPGAADGSVVLDATDTNLPPLTTFKLGGEVHDDSGARRNGICNQITGSGVTTGSDLHLTCDGTTTPSTTNSPFSAYANPTYTGSWCEDHPSNWDVKTTTGCGYLYNYYTATAGTVNYNEIGGVTISSYPASAPGDICPKGWHLPSGSDTAGEFATLLSTTPGSVTPYWLYSGPFASIFAGDYAAVFGGQGSGGYSWSSTVHSANKSFSAMVYATHGVLLDISYEMHYGFPMRCVL